MDTVLDAGTDLGGHHGVLQPASLWGLPSGKLTSQLNMHHLIICKKGDFIAMLQCLFTTGGYVLFLLGCCSMFLSN